LLDHVKNHRGKWLLLSPKDWYILKDLFKHYRWPVYGFREIERLGLPKHGLPTPIPITGCFSKFQTAMYMYLRAAKSHSFPAMLFSPGSLKNAYSASYGIQNTYATNVWLRACAGVAAVNTNKVLEEVGWLCAAWEIQDISWHDLGASVAVAPKTTAHRAYVCASPSWQNKDICL
jgi:hypothetical protein